MERQNKLADLSLVAKYYPVSNYSYPRCDAAPYRQRPEGTGRSSVGSDCSVPSMIHDCESDVSAEDDYQYHVSGAELWDSFWHSNNSKRIRFPALIPSPAVRRHHHPHPGRTTDVDEQPREVDTTAWPLPESPHEAPPRPKTPKPATYSLFPSSQKTPTRPIHPPRKSSLSTIPRQPLEPLPTVSVPAKSTTGALEDAFSLFGPATSPVSSIPRPGSSPQRPNTSHAHCSKPSLPVPTTTTPRLTQRVRAASATTLHQHPPLFAHTTPLAAFNPAQKHTAAPPSTSQLMARPSSPSPPLISVFEDSSDSEPDRGHGGFFSIRRRPRRATKGAASSSDGARAAVRGGKTEEGGDGEETSRSRMLGRWSH